MLLKFFSIKNVNFLLKLKRKNGDSLKLEKKYQNWKKVSPKKELEREAGFPGDFSLSWSSSAIIASLTCCFLLLFVVMLVTLVLKLSIASKDCLFSLLSSQNDASKDVDECSDAKSDTLEKYSLGTAPIDLIE